MGGNTTVSQAPALSDIAPEVVHGESGAAGTRMRQVFVGQASQLRLMRRWFESLLAPGSVRDDVLSVATELASNAIRHTASGEGGCFAVELTCAQAVIRVAVTDDGGPAEPTVLNDPGGQTGRGLLLVRGLSEQMGVFGNAQGRTVWAEISQAGT